MDRKGNFKIALILILIGVLIDCGLIFFLNWWERKISTQQLKELGTIYPKMQVELAHTFTYYNNERMGAILCICILIVIVTVGILGLIYSRNRKRQKLQIEEERERLKLLEDCLETFQKNNFTIKRDIFNTYETMTDEWKQMEESLHKLSYYLEAQKNQLDTEENSTKALITNISHQLNTPLASLKMCFELSRETTLTDEEREEFVNKENQEILKLESLIEELVKLSRLESHMIQIDVKRIKIQDLITESISQVFMKAHAKEIAIDVNESEPIDVQIDMKWTSEAIVNVLDNAIKYSNTGTKITVTTKKLPHLALIEIDDEGIGIQEKDLHRIFQRFYRGENAGNFTKEGAGVGLYLARKIIEDQGGTITAKKKAIGTTFRITLPR